MKDALTLLSIRTPSIKSKSFNSNSESAFTIVELLVVIVVIAILAAITIVSYTGITQKAIVSALQSDLDNASRQLKLYETDHGSFPTSLDGSYCPLGTAPSPDPKYCLKTSNGNSLAYTPLINSFKLIATKNTTSYYVTSDGSPNNKNLLYLTANPDEASFEGITVGAWIFPPGSGDAAMTISSDWSKHGSKSLKLTTSSTPNDQPNRDVTAITSPGTQYTLSSYCKAVDGGNVRVSAGDNVSGTSYGNSISEGSEGLSKMTVTFNATSASRYIGFYIASTDYPHIHYVDAIQLESGSTATPF